MWVSLTQVVEGQDRKKRLASPAKSEGNNLADCLQSSSVPPDLLGLQLATPTDY